METDTQPSLEGDWTLNKVVATGLVMTATRNECR